MLYTNNLSSFLNDILAHQARIIDDAFVYDSVTKQDNGSTKIEVVVPGYSKEDLKLDISNNVLTLTSELKDKKFSRKWRLSDSIDIKSITAECKNGILSIIVQEKSKQDKTRLIEIK
jgi:HSP20 family molecular chaperone IbpA